MDKSITCTVHVPGNFSDERKVLGDFGYKYVKSKTTKDLWNNLALRQIFNRHQDNNHIFNSAVDEILMHENEKLIAMKEAHKKFESIFDDNKLYQIENMSLE